MKHLRLAALLPALLLSLCVFGQKNDKPKENKPPAWSADRLVFGGVMDARFGVITYVNLSPVIGYKITDRYQAGLGPVYMYFSNNQYHFSTNIYGATFYNRYYLTDYLFLHAEYQPLNGPWDPYINQRYWLNNVWVGGGLSQQLGSGRAYLMCLFNVNETEYSFPPSPRISLVVAF